MINAMPKAMRDDNMVSATLRTWGTLWFIKKLAKKMDLLSQHTFQIKNTSLIKRKFYGNDSV
jgi:hypothetical protein